MSGTRAHANETASKRVVHNCFVGRGVSTSLLFVLVDRPWAAYGCSIHPGTVVLSLYGVIPKPALKELEGIGGSHFELV
jgi:hypothetical protein